MRSNGKKGGAIVTTPSTSDHAMESWDDATSIAIEDNLWWLVGRRMVVRSFLDPIKPISTLMDIGCGSGGNLPVLAEYGTVYGVELSPVLAERARNRGIAEKVYTEDFFALSDVPPADVYTLMDVLEHIEDDNGFIRKLRDCAPPGHRLLISVPASPWLYSQHDVLLPHDRRDTAGQLRDVLERNGYTVLRMNHFMCFLFPAAVLARLKEKLSTRKPQTVDLGVVPGGVNKLLTLLLRLETWLGKWVRYPFGISVFALALYEPQPQTASTNPARAKATADAL